MNELPSLFKDDNLFLPVLLRRLEGIRRPNFATTTLIPDKDALLVDNKLIIAYNPTREQLLIAREATQPVMAQQDGKWILRAFPNPKPGEFATAMINAPLTPESLDVYIGDGYKVSYSRTPQGALQLTIDSAKPIKHRLLAAHTHYLKHLRSANRTPTNSI